MSTLQKPTPATALGADKWAKLRQQYGCGPVEFSGTDNALYERHLVFDNVRKPTDVSPRDRFEAFARSVRDILSQRWLLTEDAYARENPKRVCYLSMEFLIGRSLANNVMNLLLEPLAKQAAKQKNLDWLGLLEQEPDAGLGNGGLGRLAACFLDSMATMQLPAMGYGLRYEYGMFRQTIRDGWQQEQPDNWLRRPDSWEVARPQEKVEVKLGCSFQIQGGALRAILGKASTLIGIPFDRPVVGYGGKTINTLRLFFLPEYDVTLAERLIPASDVSNQISTAGYEASGTSNMKFMMNGALTVGTRDGATIEMAEEAGEENFFLFGLTADQVANSRGWYNPHWHYDHEPETRAALDLIFADHFSRNEPGIFASLRDTLLTNGDYYMHLADLQSYLEADQRLVKLYADPNGWARKAILNMAGSGKFSSDRTIAEYAAGIWNAEPCPVS
jgi:glucan phosphorylase